MKSLVKQPSSSMKVKILAYIIFLFFIFTNESNSFQSHIIQNNNIRIQNRNTLFILNAKSKKQNSNNNEKEESSSSQMQDVDSTNSNPTIEEENNHTNEVISKLESKYYSSKKDKDKSIYIKEAAAGLQRTSNQLSSMTGADTSTSQDDTTSNNEEFDSVYKSYLLQSATTLKDKLETLKLKSNGRKNDLAKRLAKYDLGFISSPAQMKAKEVEFTRSSIGKKRELQEKEQPPDSSSAATTAATTSNGRFCNIAISKATEQQLNNAGYMNTPTPIQSEALPHIYSGNDCILHAETGSGKTLAYLIPIIEQHSQPQEDDDEDICLILTPTRELSYQVASILMEFMNGSASAMKVTLVTHPKNLMETSSRDYKLSEYGGRVQRPHRRPFSSNHKPVKRFVVGSAKSVHSSLFGDDTCTSPATPKPAKNAFLRSVKWLVLDEVDRMLNIPKGRKDTSYKKHEKPASILTSHVMKLTLSKCQVICASATVGRPLRRELCRVLGLPSAQCPAVLRPATNTDDINDNPDTTSTTTRAITIPDTIKHYILPSSGSSTTTTTTTNEKSTTTSIGSLLTTTAFALKAIPQPQHKKILLVITRKYCQNFSITQAVNSLTYFKIQPTPQSLSSALENAVNSGQIMDMESILSIQQEISRSVGIGQQQQTNHDHDFSTDTSQESGYLYLTNEDSIRGLHFSSLDLVIIVGTPISPDEYIHIAGRTGRAGSKGCVLNIVSNDMVAKLNSWESMLGVDFIPMMDFNEIPTSLDL